MRFYTKEWYTLTQHQNDLQGFRKIPDGTYTDREIRIFYERDLKGELARQRKRCGAPAGADRHLLLGEYRQAAENTALRPVSDPGETIAWFQKSYRLRLRAVEETFPGWVLEQADRRLLALYRRPESVYYRLLRQRWSERRAIQELEKRAEAALARQEIPVGLRAGLDFRDTALLRLRRQGSNAQLLVRRSGARAEGDSPYCRICFRGVETLERERGLVIRGRWDEAGSYDSNCRCLCQELYREAGEYQLHLLVRAGKALRYLTIRCREICLETGVGPEALH